MNSLLSAYSLVYLASALVPLVAIVFAWKRRSAAGARWLLMLLLASTEWILTTAIAWANIDRALRITCSQLSYLGATVAPVFLLFFALEYTGRVKTVSPVQVAQLIVLPLASAFAAVTNDSHKLIWTSITSAPESPTILVYSHGPLYWLVTVYGLVITLAATVVLVGFALRTRRLYRDQSATVITAAFIPWVAHIVYSAMPGALVWFDPGMTVGISAALFTFSLLRYQLLDLVPVARDVLVEQMPEGLMVLDAEQRIVDLNPAAHSMLRLTDDRGLGKPLPEVMSNWPELIERFTDMSSGSYQFSIRTPWGSHLSIETWALGDESIDGSGRAALLSDVTAQVRTEQVLDDARNRLGTWMGEIEGLEAGLQGKSPRTPARRPQ